MTKTTSEMNEEINEVLTKLLNGEIDSASANKKINEAKKLIASINKDLKEAKKRLT